MVNQKLKISALGVMLWSRLRAVFRQTTFPGSAAYWEARYRHGGNSGSGSFGRLAEFKATIVNQFVVRHGISSVLELGCGDGNQLMLARYPSYIGVDVSESAIRRCVKLFAHDLTKRFLLYERGGKVPQAELVLSLDVIYHLVEDQVFEEYMQELMRAALAYVIIYSSNKKKGQVFHEKMRDFTDWVDKKAPHFRLVEVIKNPYPYDAADPENTSQSDFYIYQRVQTTPAAGSPGL